MKRLIILSAIAAFLHITAAHAQTNRFSATTGDVSLSAAATTLTVQLPAAGPAGNPSVTLESFIVYCTVACSVTQAYNGAAATATAVTVSPIPPNTTLGAAATAWKASNVGSGTAVGGIIHVPAGGTITISLAQVTLAGAGNGANYSVTVGAITGTANITAIWSERQ